jgi:exodeoxyribonuclease-3
VRIYSWNVNGLRACAEKGFGGWLSRGRGQIVSVQEVRARPEQLPPALAAPRRWHARFAVAERKGYSGVGTFSRMAPDATETTLGTPELDREGRFLHLRYGGLHVVNAYFPNGNGSVLPGGRRSNDRVPYKLRFYRAVFDALAPAFHSGAPILIMGDFNTAHTALDLARPKDNKDTSGFLPEERAELQRWLDAGWVDTFRRLHPDLPGRYSWWAQRNQCRARNIGWRIDYILASPGAAPYLQGAHLHPRVLGSDHCPVSVDVDHRILDGAPPP